MTRLFVSGLAGLWLTLFVMRALAAGPGPSDAAVPAQPIAARVPGEPDGRRRATPQSQAGYVGQETCVTCHEGYDTTINASKHGFVRDARTPAAAQGCETCHGPGEAHAQDPEKVKPRQFDKISAKAVTDTCTTCHNRGPHALWSGSQHEARNVSCVTCHSVHAPQIADGPAQGGRSTEAVRELPSRQGRQARQVRAHAGARRKDGVFLVPQPARIDERAAAQDRPYRQRVLYELSRREARAVPLRARRHHR